jgi:fructose/tagatose bisphosphate aldolase
MLFDGSALPLEENVQPSTRAVEAIKAMNSSSVVEGEIGYAGSSSTIVEQAPEGADILTAAEEAKQFVNATGIDV